MRSELAFSASQLPHLEYSYNKITDEVMNVNFLCFDSVPQSHLTLCHPMDCSTPGFPVHHQLLELLKLMSIMSVISSNQLILCSPFLPIFNHSSIRVFSNESVLRIRWQKFWSFSFSISHSNEYSELISFRKLQMSE